MPRDKDKMNSKAGRAARAAGSAAGRAVSLALKIIFTAILVLLTAGLLFVCIFAFYVKTSLVDELDISLDDYSLSESSTVYDRDGNVLATLKGSENRIWVDYEDIPEDLEHALVAIEDKRFYDHKGVDWYRTVGAVFNMFLGMRDNFGGSTITQQLIKNLTGENEVTVQRKLVEIFRALEFEKKYDKDEIIEWYLNAVYFGEGCNGIYTAAQTYFGKEPSELTLAECASIVGIVNLPTYYSPFYSVENNKDRQETVLREMYEQGYISYTEYTEAKERGAALPAQRDRGRRAGDILLLRRGRHRRRHSRPHGGARRQLRDGADPALLRRLPYLHLQGLRYPGHSRRGV